MRQYDILKQMERVGKSLPMVVGQEAPTIIQPPLYKARFINAMEKYFMTVPNKWTSICLASVTLQNMKNCKNVHEPLTHSPEAGSAHDQA